MKPFIFRVNLFEYLRNCCIVSFYPRAKSGTPLVNLYIYFYFTVLFGKINTLEVMVARVKMNLDEVELYLNKAESTIIDPGCVTSTSYNSALTGNEQTRKSKVLPNLMVNSNSFYIKLIIIENTLLILKLTLHNVQDP